MFSVHGLPEWVSRSWFMCWWWSCCIFHFQILEFDSPAALLADENSQFRAMIQASEHQSRWKTPGRHFRFELRPKCGFAQTHMRTRAHANYSSLHPTTAFNRCLSKQETRIILKERWNLTMQSNPSFCCNVIKMIFHGPKKWQSNTEQRLSWSHFIIHVDASGKLLFPQKLKGETINVTNLQPYWARTMLWMCSIHI